MDIKEMTVKRAGLKLDLFRKVIFLLIVTVIVVFVMQLQSSVLIKPDIEAPSPHLQSESSKDIDPLPYSRYNRFGMEWITIVDELNWQQRHGYAENKNTETPFDIGNGSLGLTSTMTTRVMLHNTNVQKGEFVHVVIEARDKNNRRRNRGGDFFMAVMQNTKLGKSTAGRVIDYANGTYSVYFYAAWAGKAEVTVQLAFTREIINFIRQVVKTKEKLQGIAGNFTDGVTTESSNCSMISEGLWSDKCEYMNANSMGKTVLVCDRPSTLECSQLNIIGRSVQQMNKITADQMQGAADLFESISQMAWLPATPVLIQDAEVYPRPLQQCGSDIPVPLSDGYWETRELFIPLVCHSKQWSKEEVHRCLSDKTIIASGDSTVKQIVRLMRYEHAYNMRFHFMAPRAGQIDETVPEFVFESDLIDNITYNECQSKVPIVMLNFGFHYGMWSTQSYIERLFRAKLAVERLLKRCPNSKVMIKLSHPREHVFREQSIHSSNWVFFDQNRIIRYVFAGIGVLFLDIWDMVLSSFETNTVHMPPVVISQEIHLMLSYICPEMVGA
ncbi:NXPE family member 3-like [Saccoglossus kowalevskii]|uniref:NXPE family member 3-like n=1 Tax=Saccoglossus kowalevskii TaxID=10224 RepID=A0ABM0GPM6_SACKO|nr:PREDICTED: NXPE family member 3-like [Saccoglossus kowalevskii]